MTLLAKNTSAGIVNFVILSAMSVLLSNTGANNSLSSFRNVSCSACDVAMSAFNSARRSSFWSMVMLDFFVIVLPFLCLEV